MTGALIVWLALMTIGFFVGYSLANQNMVVAGGVGVILAGAVWVVLCWTFGLMLRVRLQRRGYDLSPQARRG